MEIFLSSLDGHWLGGQAPAHSLPHTFLVLGMCKVRGAGVNLVSVHLSSCSGVVVGCLLSTQALQPHPGVSCSVDHDTKVHGPDLSTENILSNCISSCSDGCVGRPAHNEMTTATALLYLSTTHGSVSDWLASVSDKWLRTLRLTRPPGCHQVFVFVSLSKGLHLRCHGQVASGLQGFVCMN